MSRARLAEQNAIDEELLQLLARQGRRVPYPVAISVLVLAFMAGDTAPLALTATWVLLALAVLVLRWWALGRLPGVHGTPLRHRVRWAIGLSAVNGLVFTASFAFTPWLSDYELMVQTILLLGMCAGAVATTAGHREMLLVFLGPVVLANAAAWAMGGGSHHITWLELGLAALILGFGAILSGLARDAYRVFTESVLIRQQQMSSNQQLRGALMQAEQAMQAKTRFLAAASHDLRQPMHTLSLLSAALMRRPLDAATQDIGRSMNLALASLASQMDALLDISKLDAKVVAVNNQVFALDAWLARLCAELQAQAVAKGLTLTLDCPGGVFIESDPLLLERVLRNLLDNAIKYTAQGGVRLGVEGCREEGWTLVVSDSGCGIPPAEQARVFEEFYQIGNPERDRAKGLGLGLSIVSRLVDLLDLPLTLQSLPGRGSSFSLTLGTVEAMPVSALVPASEAPPLPLQHLQVLVLDDEALVREAMQALLTAHGCEVVLAGSTREALVASLRRRPDIVLSDLRLRDGDDGIKAVHSLRGALPGLPAVLISGDTSPERLREAHAAGLVLLHKPVSEAALLAAIRSALEAR